MSIQSQCSITQQLNADTYWHTKPSDCSSTAETWLMRITHGTRLLAQQREWSNRTAHLPGGGKCLQLSEQQSFYQACKGATCKCFEVTRRITHVSICKSVWYQKGNLKKRGDSATGVIQRFHDLLGKEIILPLGTYSKMMPGLWKQIMKHINLTIISLD